MTCHCGKIYPNSIPGIYYFETWWKSKCKSCEKETTCCSTNCSNNYTCKSCKRDNPDFTKIYRRERKLNELI